MEVMVLLAPARRAVPGCTAVTGLERLSGGANNETWAFDAVVPGGAVPLVLRRAPGGQGTHAPAAPGARVSAGPRAYPPPEAALRAAADPDDAAIGAQAEASVLRAVAAGGVPVPSVRAVLEPADGLGEGFVMERLPGETRPKRLLHDAAFACARERVLADCGRALARLHALPLASMPPLRVSTAAGELALWERRWRRHGGARPVFELALRWLHDHVPPAVPAVPLHGDVRTGNLLVDRDGLRALLDWELAHAGDPMSDLGWFCVASWRFGELDARAGGFGPLQALLDAYRAAGGEPDADRVRYWEVLGTFRWGVMCLDMAQAWRSGRDRSVERTAVGRRASEAELDLLRLLAPRPA